MINNALGAVLILLWLFINVMACVGISECYGSIIDSFDDGIKIGHLLLLFILPAFIINGLLALLFTFIIIPILKIKIFKFK